MASLLNRLATSGSFNSAFRTLIATSRCSVSSRALYTVPMPPRPILSRIRYLPTLLPTMVLAEKNGVYQVPRRLRVTGGIRDREVFTVTPLLPGAGVIEHSLEACEPQ